LYSLNGNLKTIASYKYDAIGRMTKKLYAPSDAVESNQTGLWTNLNTWQGGSLPTIADQVTINQGHTVTIPTGQTMQAGTLFNRGTLQNFGILQMGTLAGNVAGTLQTLDYKYHIRGGLKTINTDANNNLTNSLFSYKLDYEDDGTYFDGNIRKQTWKSNLDNVTRSYTYSYDGASRILQGSYTSTKANENYALNSVIYDANGNITNLSRNGATNTNFSSFGVVDNLSYTYPVNSNKLSKIQDLTTGNVDLGDFRDGTNTDDDYEYWLDGSLKKDKNKKVASITYNFLKLPEVITFDDAKTITTEYDAGGTKLKKMVSGGEVTDYEEDDIYVNGVLYQTSHDEGRIANGIFEYNITDHNNDLRIAFRDSAGIAVPTQSIFYDPWGLTMKGMQITRNPSNFNKYQFLNREAQFETGYIDLINRQFDPQIGRFASQDPIIEGQEHLSLYQYGWNNPVLKSDPNGLEPPCCDNLPAPKVTSDATNVSKGTPVPLSTPYGGPATSAFSLSITAGKQVGIEVAKVGFEANFGSTEFYNTSSPADNNTTVVTSGFSVGYGVASLGAEKKVTTTQGEKDVSTSVQGLTMRAKSTTTTENTSTMTVGLGKTPLSASIERSKTTTSYELTNGIVTPPVVTGRNTTSSISASKLPLGGERKRDNGTTFSIGLGIKVEVKVDLKQAWDNIMKYGL
jgi:RHS repeat-associated protein